ncbi:MAG: hypothetical protein M3Q60_15415 [Actinomycetota bacterium]|nr:hypothetical protein [Actinomycetota bacterium]
MNDGTEVAGNAGSPLPPEELYRLAGERLAELIPEVDSLRAEAYDAGGRASSGERDAGTPEWELRELELCEAEERMDGCLRVMERAQRHAEAGVSMEAAWGAASEALARTSREARDLTRQRAEFSLELYAQERMSGGEAEERLERIEARLAALAVDAERARLALALIEAREDRDLSAIGKRAGDGGNRRLRPRLGDGRPRV